MYNDIDRDVLEDPAVQGDLGPRGPNPIQPLEMFF